MDLQTIAVMLVLGLIVVLIVLVLVSKGQSPSSFGALSDDPQKNMVAIPPHPILTQYIDAYMASHPEQGQRRFVTQGGQRFFQLGTIAQPGERESIRNSATIIAHQGIDSDPRTIDYILHLILKES